MTLRRLLHDFEWMTNAKGKRVKSRMELPYRDGKFPRKFPGGKAWNGTPETAALYLNPPKLVKGEWRGSKGNYELPGEWDAFLKAINTERAYKFIKSPPAGWSNRDHKIDTIGFGGGNVDTAGERAGSFKVKTFKLDDKPPSPRLRWWYILTGKIHKMTVITRQGTIVKPAEGIDVYIFLIGKRGELWVPKVRVR